MHQFWRLLHRGDLQAEPEARSSDTVPRYGLANEIFGRRPAKRSSCSVRNTSGVQLAAAPASRLRADLQHPSPRMPRGGNPNAAPPQATSYDKALFLLASQATFMPRRRAMLPIHDVRAASNPAWMGAFGVLRLRMHSRKFLT